MRPEALLPRSWSLRQRTSMRLKLTPQESQNRRQVHSQFPACMWTRDTTSTLASEFSWRRGSGARVFLRCDDQLSPFRKYHSTSNSPLSRLLLPPCLPRRRSLSLSPLPQSRYLNRDNACHNCPDRPRDLFPRVGIAIATIPARIAQTQYCRTAWTRAAALLALTT